MDNKSLLDGRNRLAACKMAGVEPIFETWTGDNPIAYIVSCNVHRRHIAKSQVAMAMALEKPEPETVEERGRKGGAKRGAKVAVDSINSSQIDRGMLSIVAALQHQHVPSLRCHVARNAASLQARRTAAAPDLVCIASDRLPLSRRRMVVP